MLCSRFFPETEGVVKEILQLTSGIYQNIILF